MSLFDHHRAPAGNALSIEWRGSESAAHGSVIDHGDVVSGDLFAEFARQERRATVNRIAVHGFRNVLEQRTRYQRIEDHRHLSGLGLAGSETTKRALSRDLADLLGILQQLHGTCHGVPEVALHVALFIFRYR